MLLTRYRYSRSIRWLYAQYILSTIAASRIRHSLRVRINVLIGKNNAGKSNILSAIELVFMHLQSGRLSGPFALVVRRNASQTRQYDTFSNRNRVRLNVRGYDGLRKELIKEAALERAVEEIKQSDKSFCA